MKVCAFTGHRFLTDDFDRELLKRVTENLAKNGVKKVSVRNGGRLRYGKR